jgi:hypothetical protein
MPTSTTSDFESVRAELKEILSKYATGSLKATGDAGDYRLIGPPTEASRGKEVWFGAVAMRKNYVSYHFMPVYAFPDLLEEISPELKKRMQGKACFNFKSVDEKLFKELAKLTDKGYKRYKKEKWVK